MYQIEGNLEINIERESNIHIYICTTIRHEGTMEFNLVRIADPQLVFKDPRARRILIRGELLLTRAGG